MPTRKRRSISFTSSVYNHANVYQGGGMMLERFPSRLPLQWALPGRRVPLIVVAALVLCGCQTTTTAFSSPAVGSGRLLGRQSSVSSFSMSRQRPAAIIRTRAVAENRGNHDDDDQTPNGHNGHQEHPSHNGKHAHARHSRKAKSSIADPTLSASSTNHVLQNQTTTATSSFSSLPQHVAFICDGNARWAQSKGLPTVAGHVAGADRLVQVLQTLKDQGIQYCTLYAFSTENWQRSTSEIQDLMHVMERTARRLAPQILAQSPHLRIRILGNLQDDRIPSGLRSILTQLQEATSHCKQDESSQQDCRQSQTICLAINYGGRHDILQASQQLAHGVVDAMTSNHDDDNMMDEHAVRQMIDQWQENDLAQALSTRHIPPPDLLIRTSGEHRLSNFLLWDLAYTEIYFADTLWPDFDTSSVLEAFAWYAHRQRRFGTRQSSTEKVFEDDTKPPLSTSAFTSVTGE